MAKYIRSQYEIESEIQSIQASLEWSKKGAMTSEVERLTDSLAYQKAALVESKAYYAPDAVAARNAAYEATMKEYHAAMKAAGMKTKKRR